MSEPTKEAPKVEAPAPELHPDGAPILKGAQATAFWPTQQKAEEIAKARTKGARRAFTVKDAKGNTRYATASHVHFLEEYILCTELGWNIDEVGKPAASRAPVTATGVLAAIDALPEAEREAVKKQLEALLGSKVAPKK